jgi:hypothetical protein
VSVPDRQFTENCHRVGSGHTDDEVKTGAVVKLELVSCIRTDLEDFEGVDERRSG